MPPPTTRPRRSPDHEGAPTDGDARADPHPASGPDDIRRLLAASQEAPPRHRDRRRARLGRGSVTQAQAAGAASASTATPESPAAAAGPATSGPGPAGGSGGNGNRNGNRSRQRRLAGTGNRPLQPAASKQQRVGSASGSSRPLPRAGTGSGHDETAAAST